MLNLFRANKSHPKRIGMDRGPNPFPIGHTWILRVGPLMDKIYVTEPVVKQNVGEDIVGENHHGGNTKK